MTKPDKVQTFQDFIKEIADRHHNVEPELLQEAHDWLCNRMKQDHGLDPNDPAIETIIDHALERYAEAYANPSDLVYEIMQEGAENMSRDFMTEEVRRRAMSNIVIKIFDQDDNLFARWDFDTAQLGAALHKLAHYMATDFVHDDDIAESNIRSMGHDLDRAALNLMAFLHGPSPSNHGARIDRNVGNPGVSKENY